MPPTLPIDLSNFPAFQTRKALLVIDLQNEFLSPQSSLFVSKPAGYLERGLDVVKRFRESGAGDVFWIRSQFDAHRPTANARIVTSSTPSLSARPNSNSGGDSAANGPREHRTGPKSASNAEPSQDADPEAFLSIADTTDTTDGTGSTVQNSQGHSMLPGSFGSELMAQVASAINTRQDLVVAKSHYSAFESTQLLTRLRTRFVTELYIFGALTNISIYATALDAARHGLTLTIVEDCCGYRNAMRHNNALQSLVRLTGCDTLLADHVLETLPAPRASPQGSSSAGAPSGLPLGSDFAAAIAAITASSHGPPGARRGGSGALPVRSKINQKAPASTSPSPSSSSSRLPPAVGSPVLPSVSTPPAPPVKPVVSAASSSQSSQLSSKTPQFKPVLQHPPAGKGAPAAENQPVALEDKSKGKPQIVSPSVCEDCVKCVEDVMESSSDRIEPARSALKTTSGTISTPRHTYVPPALDEIDVGGITPDDGENADSDLDDSFIPVLPSRTAKLLEYSRLRAKHQAEILKKQGQQQIDGQRDGASDKKDESTIKSRLQYKKVAQPVRVRGEASRPAKATDSSSGTETESVSQLALSKVPTSTTASTKEPAGASLSESKSEAVNMLKVVKASNDLSSEVVELKKLEQEAKATSILPSESLTAPTKGAADPAIVPKEASATDTVEAPRAAGAVAISPSTGKDPSDMALQLDSIPPAQKLAKPDSTASIAESPIVPVDMTKKPAATEPICAGDTIIYHNVLPAALEEGIYERLRDEVQWQRMSHQGGEVPRLVCVQGGVETTDSGGKDDMKDDGKGGGNDDGDTIPVYRHPADESPPLENFTPTVRLIKQHIEAIVGHPLNHALIQYYRNGNDYISEHSDKTLDIVPGSYVCNMSLGAERMMIFRTKRLDKDPSKAAEESSSAAGGKENGRTPETGAATPAKRQSCRVQLPHNSLCRMGLKTNEKWLHAIRQDKRADRDKSEPEMAFGGGRISLTFRQIGTFLNKSETLIWGQGAVGKTRAEARPVINGQSDQAIAMLRAFGTENHSSSFDWARHYGAGFDVLHMSSAPRFFASTDKLVNSTIQLLLAELGISYARGSLGGKDVQEGKEVKDDASKEASSTLSSLEISVRFVDNDRDRCTVQGLLGILLYVDSVYGKGSAASKQTTSRQNLEIARVYTQLQQAILLQDSWRAADSGAKLSSPSATATTAGPAFSLKLWKGDLATWNAYVSPVPHADATKRDGKDQTADKSPADKMLFIAGGSSQSLADYALLPVLHGMEQAFTTAAKGAGSSDSEIAGSKEPLPTFRDELKRLGFPYLARYYTQIKAHTSFGRVMLAGDK